MKRVIGTALLIAVTSGGALAQTAEIGEKVFKKCKACHQIGEGAKNKTGPVLNGVVGRAAGTSEGFKYSKSMVAAAEAGLVWDAELLDQWLTDPKAFLKTFLDDPKAKAKMTFKLKKPEDRAAIIAFLGTL